MIEFVESPLFDNLFTLYKAMDKESRNKYLKDQIFSKYAIMDILNKC